MAIDFRPADVPAESSSMSLRQIVWLTLPLSLTFLMMSGAAPVVTGGISWSFGPEGERVHLASFFLAFSAALFLYSPAFAARNIALRAIFDRKSLVRFVTFNLSWAVFSSLAVVAVSLSDGLGRFIFVEVLAATDPMQVLAREGLLMFAPIPFLIILRGMGQACHISNDQAWYVGIGTALRLLAMGVFVFGFAVHGQMSGPVLGGLTFLIGIGVETAFVLVMLRGKPQWTTSSDKPVLTYRQFARYSLPLMGASTVGQLVAPFLIYLINHARLPAESLSSYDLIRGTLWVLLSVLIALQTSIVNYATSAHNFRVLVRFGGWMLASTTILFVLIAYTPAGEWLYRDLLRVDNDTIRGLTFRALQLVLPLPLLTTLALSFTALHTRSGRTGWVMAGSVAGLGSLLVMSRLIELGQVDGALVAVVGFMLFQFVTMVVQSLGFLGGGLKAALTEYELSEKWVVS